MTMECLSLTTTSATGAGQTLLFPYNSGRTADDYLANQAVLVFNDSEIRIEDKAFSVTLLPTGAQVSYGAGPSIPAGGVILALPLSAGDDLAGVIFPITASRTLAPKDNGKVFRSDASSGIALTVPATLPKGFNIAVSQWGAGAVTITAGSGATNRSSTTATSAQYKTVSLLVVKNTGGSAAEFIAAES